MVRGLLRACSAAALAALLVGGGSRAQSPGPQGDGRLAAVLAKMVEVQRGIRTLRVNFTQTNQFAMLAKPQILKGTLTIQKPSAALYAYKSPAALYFRVKDGDLLVYNEEKKEAFVQDIRRHEGRIAKYLGLTQPMEELKKTFVVALASEEGGKATLRLVPTRAKVKEKIAEMKFTVGIQDGAVHAFDIVEPGGDRLAFEFREMEINPKLTDKDFEIPIPPGVKVKREMLDLKGPFGN